MSTASIRRHRKERHGVLEEGVATKGGVSYQKENAASGGMKAGASAAPEDTQSATGEQARRGRKKSK